MIKLEEIFGVYTDKEFYLISEECSREFVYIYKEVDDIAPNRSPYGVTGWKRHDCPNRVRDMILHTNGEEG